MNHSLLIVEDDADQRDVLEMFLSRAGYDVTATATADEALDVACDENCDAVLLDQFLPDMDGLAVMPRLRMLLGDVPFIVMTGDDQVIDTAKDAGAFACLLKPFRLSLVEAMIEEAIERHAVRLLQRAEASMPVLSIP